MTFIQGSLLFIAALVAGALNAVAGGGSFLTVPGLIFTGVLPVTANATSTVALWPGYLGSLGAYRKEVGTERRLAITLGITSLVGGILGALLLLHTSQATFSHLLPFLLLIATILFTISKPLTDHFRRAPAPATAASPRTLVISAGFQLIVAIYGGYFGGGIGILMLAAFSLMGMQNIHAMNALKTLLAMGINGVAVVLFIVAGIVAWPQAIVMLFGAIIGGYGGAAVARKLPSLFIRRFVIVVGFSISAYFFIRLFV